jgi:3,4-dihydroxy 2-butanone 4-phosphate synthase / GTP cyclohydrolase II
VICEIMNEDGSMARLPELREFAAQHGLKIGTIADLIRYRTEHESTVQRVGECVMPTEFGDFRVLAYHDDISDSGAPGAGPGRDPRRPADAGARAHAGEPARPRHHGASRRFLVVARGARLRGGRRRGRGGGILQQEEKPADLVPRVRHFHRQGKALESAARQARHQEMRTYGLGSQILADLGVSKMRVLGHAMKAPGLSGFGLEIVEYVENDPAQLSSTHRRHNKEKKVSG